MKVYRNIGFVCKLWHGFHHTKIYNIEEFREHIQNVIVGDVLSMLYPNNTIILVKLYRLDLYVSIGCPSLLEYVNI